MASSSLLITVVLSLLSSCHFCSSVSDDQWLFRPIAPCMNSLSYGTLVILSSLSLLSL